MSNNLAYEYEMVDCIHASHLASAYMWYELESVLSLCEDGTGLSN